MFASEVLGFPPTSSSGLNGGMGATNEAMIVVRNRFYLVAIVEFKNIFIVLTLLHSIPISTIMLIPIPSYLC